MQSSRFLIRIPAILCIVAAVAPAWCQPPAVDLGIGERGGYFGVGASARSLHLVLTTQSRARDVSSDDLAAGDLYYVLCTSGRDWKLKQDFVTEELSKLTIGQGDEVFKPERIGDLMVEGDSTSIMLAFPKTLHLEQPLVFRFPTRDGISTASMMVPESFWPGYTSLSVLRRTAEESKDRQDYRGAITSYSQLLAHPTAPLFSFHEEVVRRRTVCFSALVVDSHTRFQQASSDSSKSLEDRIALAGEHLGLVQYVADSLVNPSLGVAATDSLAAALLVMNARLQTETRTTLDDLERQREERDTGWIMRGDMAGAGGYRYAPMLGLIAAALLRPDVVDTASVLPALSADRQRTMAQFGLERSYDAFLSVCRTRVASGQPVFPAPFVDGVRANAPRLSQPWGEIFGAIQAFVMEQNAEAEAAATAALRTCTDAELCCGLDALRMSLRPAGGAGQDEARALLAEAGPLERSGQKDLALERYKRAAAIAPDWVPGLLALGGWYDRQDDPYRANSYYTTAIQKDPQCVTAYERLFSNYSRQGTPAPAVELLAAAIKQGNAYWIIYAHLGAACNAAGEYQDAARNYEKALEINAASYDANVELGLACQNLRNFRKARECYTRAVQLDPDRDQAIERLKELDRVERGGASDKAAPGSG